MTMLDFVALGYGLGSTWTSTGGRLSNVVEAPEYAQALADVRGLVEKGVFHPDGLTANNNQRNAWFSSGVVAMVHTGFSGWSKFVAWGKDVPGYRLGSMLPVPHTLGTPTAASQGAPLASFTAIARTGTARAEQLLRTLDWLAAPFGSAEYLTKVYGVEGTSYTRDGGEVAWTDEGNAVRTVPFLYVGDGTQVIYQPGSRRRPAQFEYQEKAGALLQPDPVLGLYSETNSAKAAKLASDLQQAKTDIVSGRRPVSSWSEAVSAWRTAGGDQVRQEYEAGLQRG
jgi:putative aldouronate transport system substrate-binding protein